jgi:D-alanyl-D-alanine dipeptidase
MLRASILESLEKAQEALQESSPGWRILLTDALRPVSVQVYMVEHELTKLARAEGLEPDTLTTRQREVLMEKVLRLWAIPSLDPETPPPHSTGAVFDCTLLDETGQEVEMGSPVDENSDRSYPDYFATATDAKGRRAHQNRLYLRDLLRAQGFQRHHTEWWHFSRGDQLAIWLEHGVATDAYAIYGRADLL